jgi:hypothetical protein
MSSINWLAMKLAIACFVLVMIVGECARRLLGCP